MYKSYIWTLPTRVFHWLFALLITLEYFTDEKGLMKYHIIMGYVILILLAYRLYFGYFGPEHSKFKEFPLSIKKIKEFIKNIFNPRQKDVGHNPLASYVMLGFYVVSFFLILSGILMMGVHPHKGPFSFLDWPLVKELKLLKIAHEFLADVLLVLIFAHLAGIAFDKFFHKEHENLTSIFTGYKKLQVKQNVVLSSSQKAFTLIFTFILAVFLVYNVVTPQKENFIFKQELIQQ